MRGEIGAVPRQAVYERLGAPTGKGRIRRVQPAQVPARCAGRVAADRHHLGCRACGVVVDVDCAVGEPPCLQAADDHGSVIDEAEASTGGSAPTASRRQPQQVPAATGACRKLVRQEPAR